MLKRRWQTVLGSRCSIWKRSLSEWVASLC